VRRSLAVVLAVVLLGAVGGGCRRGDEATPLHLDGRPRIPADEGIATALSRDRITLDGRRSYDVSPELRAFSTYTLALEPMIGRKGQYVQVGLQGDTMVWMAGVARPLDVDGERSVYYRGTFVGEERGRYAFEDGTTFAPGRGVKVPAKGRSVTVRIDARSHRIVAIS
jgi:hypothetical protein